MAICGFCKKEVKFEGSSRKTGRTSKSVIAEQYGRDRMLSCPHCESVLGFTS